MDHREAILLIEKGVDRTAAFQNWADFGCGKGTFTLALADLLAGGEILAIDQRWEDLEALPDRYGQVEIIRQHGDFTATHPVDLDGVLMANSIHYVNDQADFLERLKRSVKQNGRLLIVEYDLAQANPWVPFPLPFEQFRRLALKAGFESVTKLAEKPSRYRAGNLYAALAM